MSTEWSEPSDEPANPTTPSGNTPLDLVAKILAGMHGAALVVSPEGVLLMANPAAREMFDIRAKIKGRRLSTLLGAAKVVESLLAAIAAGGTTELEIDWQGETVSFGYRNPISIRVSTVTLPEGERVGLLSCARRHDVTPTALAIQQLWEPIRQLHGPITILRGYLETLQDQGMPDGQSYRRLLQTFTKAAERLEASTSLVTQRLRVVEGTIS